MSVTLAAGTLAVGQSTTATATARDAQGGTIGGKTATWSSSNTAVATVDAGGSVTALAAGTADIVATIDGRTGQATLTVMPPPVATVSVTLGAPTISVGQATQAAAVLRDAAGATLTGRTVTWATSNAAVATVSGTGLVSGIAAGNATITATSEGRSGNAAVTVAPAVSLGALSLRNADGSAADPTNVAGRLRISADVDVPTGFRGVLEVRIRGTLARRDSITPTPGVLARLIDRVMDVPTAIATVDANTLGTSVQWTNGPADVLVTLSGQGPGGAPVSVSRTTQVTLQNMNALALIAVNPRSTTAGGLTWIGGPGTQTFVAHAAFGPGSLNGIEVIRGPASAVFGAGSVAGAVNVATRTGTAAAGAFDLAGSGWESDVTGTGYGLNSYAIGTTNYSPRSAIANLAGNAASVDASGFYTSPVRAAGVTLPLGIRYQETTFIIPAGWADFSSRVAWFDFLGARPGLGALEPRPRLSTVGQPAWVPNGTWGLSQNYLGASTNLSTFVDFSKFADNGVGPGSLNDVSWYASPSMGNLYSLSNRITSVGGIPASSTRSYYLGAAGADPLGNTWQATVKTNAANPWTTGGVVASGAQLGVTDAIFGRLTTGGSMTWGGMPSGSVFNNTSALSGYQVTATASGSLFDGAAFGGAAHKYGDVMNCLMGFTHCMIPEVLSSTVSHNGAQVATSLSLSTLRTRWSALGGGAGALQLNYSAADLGGNASSGFQPWYGFLDFVRPTANVTATNGQNGDVTVAATGTDDQGNESVDWGGRFNLTNSAFSGNKLYSWFHTGDAGGDLTTGLSKVVNTSITGRYPVAARWYNPSGTGIDRTTAIPADGVCARFRDWGRNVSLPTCVNHTPTTPIVPVSSTLSNLRAGVSTGTLCNKATCSGSTPTELTGWLEADVLGTLDELAKMFLLGIPPGGEVFPMGKAETPTLVQTLPGGGRRLRWETRFSNADYCLAFTGLMLLKIIALSSDGWNVFIPSQFFFLNVLAGTGDQPGCTWPRRALFPPLSLSSKAPGAPPWRRTG